MKMLKGIKTKHKKYEFLIRFFLGLETKNVSNKKAGVKKNDVTSRFFRV